MAISTIFSTEKCTGVLKIKARKTHWTACMMVCFPSYLVMFQMYKTMPVLSKVDASLC